MCVGDEGKMTRFLLQTWCLATTPPLAAEQNPWHYAAWIAVDFRLLLFLSLVALLGAAAICVLFVPSREWSRLAATFLLGFTGLTALLVFLFNQVVYYPVFVVESFFAFP